MNKEELIKEYNAKVNKLTQELLAKLKTEEKKPFEVELPEENDILYYICDDGVTVDATYFYNSGYYIKKFLNGHYFETREEAEQHLKEQRLLFKIKKWAEIHNEGWKPDLTDYKKEKWSIVYNIRVDGFIPHNMRVFNYLTHDLPYFRSREVAQKCIREFGKEIKETLL